MPIDTALKDALLAVPAIEANTPEDGAGTEHDVVHQLELDVSRALVTAVEAAEASVEALVDFADAAGPAIEDHEDRIAALEAGGGGGPGGVSIHYRVDDLEAEAGEDAIVLAADPYQGAVQVYRNGTLQRAVQAALTGRNIALTPAADDGDWYTVSYWTETATPGASVMLRALTLTGALPAPSIGVAYSESLTASGGVTPYTWSVSAGSLPTGLSINASTGVISGTPTTAGSYTFTVQVESSDLQTATLEQTLVVQGFRYWRLLFTGASDSYYGIYELQYRETVGGANVATGGTPSASSTYSAPTFAADKAFDGNNGTYWCSTAGAPAGSWLAYDFGVHRDIQQISVLAPAYHPTAFSVQRSINGTDWETVWSESGLTSGWGSARVFNRPT